MAVIEPTAVATEIGRSLTEAETAQVTQWILDAELLIRTRLGDSVYAALDEEVLAYVVRMAVTARLRNPSGVTEESRQIDDFKITRKLSMSGIITDDWWGWELLAPTATSGAFTIRPAGTRTRACDAETPWSAP